jgi:CarboxypepD_reg-like domain/Secretion system C-terminal sorting domain
LFMKQFNLSIPTPCHERWEQMTPTEQGRFCSSCQKIVIDFTSMTDQQLAAFFKKSMGNVCGRFAKDQLERDITVPAKRIPWLRYFFQFTLPAFLLSLKATGQKESRVERVSVINKAADTSITKVLQEAAPSCYLSGKVRDSYGNPLPFASVVINGTNQGTVSDSAGIFSLYYRKTLPFTLEISSIGYETIFYEVKDSSEKEIVIPKMKEIVFGEVVIVRQPRKRKNPIPLINNDKRDTAFNKFSVYPNPARSNGTITIDCKKMAKGIYSLQILAVDGRPLCTKQLELENKGGLLRTELPSLTTGQYILTLVSNASKKVYTEKIQVL